MIFGLLYFCVVILCVNRSRTSFILYRIVKRHSRQSNACSKNMDMRRQCLRTVYELIKPYMSLVMRNNYMEGSGSATIK